MSSIKEFLEGEKGLDELYEISTDLSSNASAQEVVDELNQKNASMREAVKHPLVGSRERHEPSWFDFEDYFDDLPVAGFVNDKAIFQNDDRQWEVKDRQSLSAWKR